MILCPKTVSNYRISSVFYTLRSKMVYHVEIGCQQVVNCLNVARGGGNFNSCERLGYRDIVVSKGGPELASLSRNRLK